MKEDRRVRKTKESLKNGLFSLLLEKPIRKITVKDVVDKADINRSTFYHYYLDVNDMLSKIEEEVFQQFQVVFEEGYQQREGGAEKEQFYINFLEEICLIIAKNEAFFRSILGDFGDLAFRHRLSRLIEDHSQDLFKEFFRRNQDEGHYRYSFVASGVIGTIKMWLDGGLLESPKNISNIINEIIKPIVEMK